VAVALRVHGGGGLPGEVAPDDVRPLPFDDGGDRAASEALALGAGVEDVAPAGERGRGLQEECAEAGGEDGGRAVGGQRGDGVEVAEPVQEGRPSTVKSMKSRCSR
jgi:hypothetical protein